MLESWHVVLRCCARLLLVGGAVTYSALAPALGLGEITQHSALNQPFNADIALVDAGGLGEGELSVSLATADEFSRAGVERVFFLNDLKFTPILRGNRSLIRVTSNKPVNEPFLNFLVQLNQPNGRLLREYTVLIDPPGSPGIVPVNDEPTPRPQSSAFPSVEPAVAPPPAVKGATPKPDVDKPATAPSNDAVAEQLAASVLQNQQLQKTIDELNAKLQGQDEQIAGQKKQVIELQTQLAEVKQASLEPVVPQVTAPVPVVVEESEPTPWLLIIGLLAVVALVLLGVFIRRQRQQVQAQVQSEPLPVLPSRHEPVLNRTAEPIRPASQPQPLAGSAEETPAGDVLEGVGIYLAYGRFSEAAGLLRDALVREPQRTDLAVQLLEVLGKQGDVQAYDTQESSLRDAGFDAQQLQDIRARHPKLLSAAPVVAAVAVAPPMPAIPEAAPSDEFQLNLDDLSMDSNWDLISPFESSPSSAKPSNEPTQVDDPGFTSNLHVLPDVFEMPEEPTLDEPELEWIAEPDAQSLDETFLNEFSDPLQPLELEPLNAELMDLEPAGPSSAGKLEQAQTCIDDGDLDSAIELLNELLKDGDEPLKETARTLLAGIR
ncbi:MULTISPECIES: FimV/HubP family polar landmark protein [Pseudomonas]|uniref:Peptidoglycan-binding protein LysM n=1 Tax=Pseudomonas wuhanensis TaxID=2954098 RepID=A0ABY9GMJ1_9PSED|nr:MULTISPECIES: FimV/HubP family polar landmark protein [unclassified Pseudomonas]WLI11156.1 peptidoglycan-binding protein LysM [Pseudomonas sp. FP603]WLI16989.1 peptidoglycan-binding protein LysM [Pseudomonas sp. FP607]